jgi:serine/threonine protein kinase
MVQRVRIQIKQLIKDLKKIMKGGGDAYGTASLIVDDKIPCDYEWSSRFYNSQMKMLTKIITDKAIYDKELENAKYIDERIGDKENLLFPMTACGGIPVNTNIREILQRYRQVDVTKESFNKNAEIIYILQIENGGESLEKLNSSGELATYNDNHLISIIDDIIGGIKHLHSKNMPHGDISPVNITIRKDTDRPRAYIIDLGEANSKSKNDSKVLSDAKNAINCVHLIAQNLKTDNPMKVGLSQIRESLSIEALVGKLTELYRSTQTDEDIERAFNERFNQGAAQEDSGTPPGSPERQGTPPPAQFDSPPPARDLFGNPSPPKKRRQEGGKKNKK